MKYQKYLFSGLVFILFCGCNSTSSKKSDNKEITKIENIEFVKSAKKETISPSILVKERLSSTKNKEIKDLLDKTKFLQVPCVYCYEDTFNINTVENVEPLFDEMQDLLSVKKINDWISDFSGILWLSCQLNLSKNFKTLIFSIFTGGEGKNIIVTYTNDFKFIDSEHITFEDYVEGYRESKSMIENDKITLYNSTYTDYPKNDTIYFKISEYGKIDTLFVASETNRNDMTIQKNNQ